MGGAWVEVEVEVEAEAEVEVEAEVVVAVVLLWPLLVQRRCEMGLVLVRMEVLLPVRL